MEIRNDIRASLAATLDDTHLIMARERIGREFDQEIDEARRDEGRIRGDADTLAVAIDHRVASAVGLSYCVL